MAEPTCTRGVKERQRVSVEGKKRLKPGAKAFSVLVLEIYVKFFFFFFSRLARQSVTKLRNGLIRVAPFVCAVPKCTALGYMVCECCLESAILWC